MLLASFWCYRPLVLPHWDDWTILQPAPASSPVLGSARDVCPPPAPWGGSLGILHQPSILGWRAFVQDLPGSSSGSFSPAFSAFCILPPGIVCFLHLFWRFLSCHLSGGYLLVKLMVTLGLDSFLSTLSAWDCFPNLVFSRKGCNSFYWIYLFSLVYTW